MYFNRFLKKFYHDLNLLIKLYSLFQINHILTYSKLNGKTRDPSRTYHNDGFAVLNSFTQNLLKYLLSKIIIILSSAAGVFCCCKIQNNYGLWSILLKWKP